MMGSPESDVNRQKNETQHEVTISKDYYLGVYEVTQAQYEKVIGKNPSYFQGAIVGNENADLPVENVSWDDAVEFCKKLSELPEHVWFDRNSPDRTHTVGLLEPNAWGLYDMHGNVWEWCSDWYGDYPKGAVRNPTGPKVGSDRVCRGGSWDFEAAICRSAFRNWNYPSLRLDYYGFRVALSSSEIPKSPEAESK